MGIPLRAMFLLFAIGLLSSINVAWASDCYAVAPNVLRVGSKEHLSVIVEGQPQDVTITLHDEARGDRTLFTWRGQVTADAAKDVDVTLREDTLGDIDLDGATTFYAVLKVQCGGQEAMVTRLLVSPATADHIFIQTDKPIYHPKGKVRFRLISLDEQLRPLKKNITLQLKNPQGIIVEEYAIRPWTTPIFSGEFDLPERTLLGEWKLVALHGYKKNANYTVTFKVEKYVLPRFSVDVRSEKPYILPGTKEVGILATAKFVNKQTVQGYATFRFGVQYDTSDIDWIGNSQVPKQLKDGEATFSLKIQDIQRKYTAQQWQALHRGHAKLVVQVNVTEEATGAKESGFFDQCVFSASPYVISLDDNQRTFKPGVHIYILAKVTYLTGQPAVRVPLTISTDRGIVKDAEAETNEYGLASFLVETRLQDGIMKAKVKTASKTFLDAEQATQNITLRPYASPGNQFIVIQRKDPKTFVKVGESYNPVVFANVSGKIMAAYFTVISRGRVLLTKKLPGGSLQNSLSFRVTEEMTPSFRVVVFAKVHDRTTTMLSDSIYVKTERSCTKNSQTEVILERQQTAPGTTEKVTVKGAEGTVVGLLGVDKALYLLHRGGLLTFDKVIDALESKDLGCGWGGGADSNEAILKSGVAVLSKYLHPTPRNDLSCHERHRRRREATQSIAEEYESPSLRKCCAYGFKRDPYHKTCDIRVEQLNEILQSEKQEDLDCIEAYERCCLFREEADEESEGITARNFGDVDAVYPDSQLGPVPDQDVRKDFRDTWLFETLTVGPSREATTHTTLPESITTWELGAVSVSPHGGICVASPKEITTFKEVFIEVNLPYSVIENEQVDVPVTVYNYGATEIQAKVFLQGTKDVCSSAKEGEISPIQRVKVPPGSGRTVVFPIVPLARGERFVQASAYTTSGSDSVRVPLRVEPPGKPTKRDVPLILDPLNERKRSRRSVVTRDFRDTIAADNKTQLVALRVPDLQNAVPGTEDCELTIIGDQMGTALEIAISDPAHLVRIPTGCGEQTMIYLAPTLYTYSYLKASGRMSDKTEDKALDAMRRGYARILTYRQGNGAYAAWTHRTPSQWLTAFVVKNLCEARKWIRVDEHTISTALAFLISKQRQDGSFVEDFPVVHTEMLGGVKNAVPMTAFVMMAFSECMNDGVQVDGLHGSNARAATYLDKNLKPSSDPYTLALGAYAFSVAQHPSKFKAAEYLRNVTSYIQGQNKRYIHAPTKSLTMEATSYALMTVINEGDDRGYIESFVNWMNEEFRPTGASSSTQDTVVGLQALAKYATYSKEDVIDLACEVTLSSDMHFNRTFRIKRDNSHVANRIEIAYKPNAQVFLHARGRGTASVLFTTTYHERADKDNLCKFNLTTEFSELNATETLDYRNAARGKLNRKQKPYRMTVRARNLEAGHTGMVNIDVGLLTGFFADHDDLDKLQHQGIIDAYETSSRGIVFYLSSVPHDKVVRLDFHVIRQYTVGNTQPSYVRIYSYYDIDTACTEFYGPDSYSPLVKTRCEKNTGVCKCAEGGCPSLKPLNRFIEDPVEDNAPRAPQLQRSLLKEHACDQSDFVWIGNITSQKVKDGYFYIDFRISETLKEGLEGDLKGEVRQLLIRDRCHEFKSMNQASYIFVGEDSEVAEVIDGKEVLVYQLDQGSLLFEEKQIPRDQKRLVTWFKTEFRKESEAPCRS